MLIPFQSRRIFSGKHLQSRSHWFLDGSSHLAPSDFGQSKQCDDVLHAAEPNPGEHKPSLATHAHYIRPQRRSITSGLAQGACVSQRDEPDFEVMQRRHHILFRAETFFWWYSIALLKLIRRSRGGSVIQFTKQHQSLVYPS